MVDAKEEETINRLYKMVKHREEKGKRLIFLNPYQIYSDVEKANSLVREDGIKGWVNAVRYYDENNQEQVLVVDELNK